MGWSGLRLVPVHPCRGRRGHLWGGFLPVGLRPVWRPRRDSVRGFLRGRYGRTKARTDARSGRPRGPRGRARGRGPGWPQRGHRPVPDDLSRMPGDRGRGGAPRDVPDVRRSRPDEFVPAARLQPVHHDHDVPEMQRPGSVARTPVPAVLRSRSDRGEADDCGRDPGRRAGWRPASDPRPWPRGGRGRSAR